MKWLEVIRIRTSQNRSEGLVGELATILSELEQKAGGPEISLYQHSAIATDYTLHLEHEPGLTEPIKSELGLLLSSIAREFGMVNHTVWVMHNHNLRSIGDKS